jgi:hypothetical protein
MDNNEDNFTPYAVIPNNAMGYSTDLGPIQINASAMPGGGDVNASLTNSPTRVGYTQQNGMGMPYAATNVNGLDLRLTPQDVSAQTNVGPVNVGASYSPQGGPALNANYRKMFENGMIDVNGSLTPYGYQAMVQGQFSF